ncbi:MAG: type II toxin-antitoxin system RelE/ParE family toxin [Bacteroidota bacterium]|nr:type II toxin-antitoxin system RelE/ParE family toxin [Bacteroidota bacterium]
MKEYKVVLESHAEEDIKNAIFWYELQQENLGNLFWKETLKCLKTIQSNPFLFQKSHKITRRAIVNKYPYGVYYVVSEQDNQVKVMAVLHFKRSGRILASRLRTSKLRRKE